MPMTSLCQSSQTGGHTSDDTSLYEENEHTLAYDDVENNNSVIFAWQTLDKNPTK